jgi:Cytochrome C oxidase, cbb3-type, subunit III
MKASLALLAVALLIGALSGCRGEQSEDPPLLPIRNMYDQEKYNPESFSSFFPDHRTMRTPVEGTMSQEEYEASREVATGLRDDGAGYVLQIPPSEVARWGGMTQMLDRGQKRFNIYCVPCHDETGSGKGMVARFQPGFPPLPSYNDPRIRQMPDGQLFATISNGVRNMPSYAAQIPIKDRWAIVSYVRALQLSMVSKAEPQK